ncbi:MAG: DUF1778 domain-containing protein [Candidatus Obscuribacterales bacterium]|jgi:uncharacterized protein (DUF1778 family)|nr:DUF1778 domain-containing protein [Candidatus Obscuribacterales bacterium]
MAVPEPKNAGAKAHNSKQQKTEKFDIRLSQQEDAIIKHAADLMATTPTNFIRQQAVLAAQAVVHDQSRFVVTNEQWEMIEKLLNAPARVLPGLKKQLTQADEWDLK